MKKHITNLFRVCVRNFLIIIFAFLLLSCGEYKDTPYGTVNDLPDVSNEAPYSDTTEREIVSMTVAAAVDYDPESNYVSLYLNVFDQDGNFIDTLNADNFGVILNNSVITDAYRSFELGESNTNMVGLILDSSGSMGAYGDNPGVNRMEDLQEAAKFFIDTMAREDMVAIIEFDDSATILQSITSDKTALKTAIDSMVIDGSTNIGDGIIECVNAIGSRPGKTAGILITDGADNGGLIDDGIEMAKKIKIPIFTIFLGSDIDAIARADLQRIADETGGKYYEVVNTSELTSIFSVTIPQELAAKPARESYIMMFENIFPSYNYVNVLVTARYLNGWGMHTTEFAIEYFVDVLTADD